MEISWIRFPGRRSWHMQDFESASLKRVLCGFREPNGVDYSDQLPGHDKSCERCLRIFAKRTST